MKIAFVNQPFDLLVPPYESSIGIWTNRVAPLFAREHDVTVYAKRSRVQTAIPGAPRLRYVLVRSLPNKFVRGLGRFFPGRLPPYASIWYNLDYIVQVALDMRRRRIDVVHVHNFTQFPAVIRALYPRVKIVLHMNGEWLSQLDQETMGGRAAGCDLVGGSSGYITGLIAERFPELAGKCRTIYNGVDVDHFRPAGGEGAAAAGEKRLLFVGRVSPEKGVHDLVRAFVSLAAGDPDLHLDLAGPGGAMPLEFIVGVSDDPLIAGLRHIYEQGVDYEGYLRRLIPPELAGRVTFWGGLSHEDLLARYHAAAVLVNPSYSESFGMSVVEGLACGLPVVVSRVGGMIEIVEKSGGGRFFERGDVAGLTAVLAELLADENRPARAALGRRGREKVVDLFSWQVLAADLMALYEELANS